MNALFYLLGVRLPVANVAQRFRAVEDRLHSLPQVERKRAYRAPSRAAPPRGAADGWTPSQPLGRRDPGRAERADRAPRRPEARLRWWQERQRTKTPCRRPCDGSGARGGRWPGQRKRGAKGPAPVQGRLLGKVPRLQVIFADKDYEGTPGGLARALLRMAAQRRAARRGRFLRRVRADPEALGRRANVRMVCKLAAAGAHGLRVSPRNQRGDDPNRHVKADDLPAQIASQDRL